MMKAIVTNRTEDYKYEIKDIVAINYVERTIILVSVEDGGRHLQILTLIILTK